MNQFISTIFVASIVFSAYSAIADDKSNTEHAMDGLTQDQEHGRMSSKMMDTNGDGWSLSKSLWHTMNKCMEKWNKPMVA